MGFYTSDNLVEFGQWAVDSKAARNQPDLRVEEPEISRNLKVFAGNVGPAVGTLSVAPVRGGPLRTVEGLPGCLQPIN